MFSLAWKQPLCNSVSNLVNLHCTFLHSFWNLDDCRNLGWDPKQNYSLLNPSPRSSVLATLATFGHEETIKEATRRFHAFLNNRSSSLFDPQIRQVCACGEFNYSTDFGCLSYKLFHFGFWIKQAAYIAVMQNVSSSNREDFDSLIELYRELNDTDESLKILSKGEVTY